MLQAPFEDAAQIVHIAFQGDQGLGPLGPLAADLEVIAGDLSERFDRIGLSIRALVWVQPCVTLALKFSGIAEDGYVGVDIAARIAAKNRGIRRLWQAEVPGAAQGSGAASPKRPLSSSLPVSLM